jgi:hypothetical protein
MSGPDFSIGENENNPGWMARKAEGLLTNPPPRYDESNAVRCIDCTHYCGRHGWCETARRNVGSARAKRTCLSFGLKLPPQPPAPPPAPMARPHPVIGVRAFLMGFGLLRHFAEIVELPDQQVGVRLRSDSTGDEVTQALVTVDQIMGLGNVTVEGPRERRLRQEGAKP